MQQVMGEVRELTANDPALQSQLLAELERAEPSLWPLVIESFRSRIAYGHQLNQKEMLASGQPVEPNAALAQDRSSLIPPGSTISNTPDSQAPPAGPSVNRLPVTDNAILPPDWSNMPPGLPQDRPTPINTTTLPPNNTPELIHPEVNPPVNNTIAPPAEDWQTTLGRAIEQLDRQINQSPRSPQLGVESTRLRLMQIALGNPNLTSTAPLSGVDPRLSDFWTNELSALDTMLKANNQTDTDPYWLKTQQHLNHAADCLAEALPLAINRLAFCRAVRSYGSIDTFESYQFKPGQRVLLYAEIDNFKSEQTPAGYHTSLRSSYRITDATGKEVARQESTATDEFCLNPRRDYFIGCDFRLPESLNKGPHTLYLTVEDIKSGKRAETSIDFTVK